MTDMFSLPFGLRCCVLKSLAYACKDPPHGIHPIPTPAGNGLVFSGSGFAFEFNSSRLTVKLGLSSGLFIFCVV